MCRSCQNAGMDDRMKYVSQRNRCECSLNVPIRTKIHLDLLLVMGKM